jgi:hypothetical protein
MGPPPNNCRQPISRSLLRRQGKECFALRMVCGLFPPEGQSFLAYARELATQAGYANPQELATLAGLPPRRLLCQVPTKPIEANLPGDPLLQAAVLGLTNEAFYGPGRPLIWTESRLRRRLLLYSVEGFYED